MSTNIGFAFSAMQPNTHAMWNDAWAAAGIGNNPTRRSWILTDTSAAVDLVHAHNRRTTGTLPPHPIQTHDFARLYTAIPLDDPAAPTRALCGRLGNLIGSIFARHAPAAWLRVHPHNTPTWRVPANPAAAPPAPSRGYFTFSADTLTSAVRQLATHTNFTFGGTVYHQHVGIPMGTNCAGHLANFFLFSYELEFITNLAATAIQPAAQGAADAAAILQDFTFCGRYLDDFITIDNPSFQHLRYNTDVHRGQNGIYPPCLTLTQSASGTAVPFLDLTILPRPSTLLPAGANTVLTTRLYDKRRSAAYASLNIIRLPHITSFLNNASKYGVVTSQFHRMRRINTDYTDFCREMGTLLYAAECRGYDIHRCCMRLHRVARQWPDLYHQQTSRRRNADAVVNDVHRQYVIYRAAHPRL